MQPQPQSQPQTQPPLAKPGPSLRLSLAILFVGLVIAIPSAIKGFAPIVSGITKTPVQTPINTTMHFSHGTYLVYENGGSLDPSDVQVFAPSGERVITTFPSDTEHITRNGSQYTGVVSFRIPSAGDYGVRINAAGHDVIVARSLLDSVKAALVWFALMGLGGIMTIAGVILIIVGSVRRGRAQRMMYAYSATYGGYQTPAYGSPYAATYGAAPPPAAPTATPPGWYPDTNNPGSQRWWDGTRWTDHTHP